MKHIVAELEKVADEADLKKFTELKNQDKTIKPNHIQTKELQWYGRKGCVAEHCLQSGRLGSDSDSSGEKYQAKSMDINGYIGELTARQQKRLISVPRSKGFIYDIQAG